MVLLILLALAILAVLLYLAGILASLHQREAQVFEARRAINDIHDQTIRSLIDAAREEGAFRKF